MKKRRLAVWMLAASMTFTLFPTTAFAMKSEDVVKDTGESDSQNGNQDEDGNGHPGNSEGRPSDGEGRPSDGEGRPNDGEGRPNDGNGRPGNTGNQKPDTSYPGDMITIPEKIDDGNYTGTATVYHDDAEDFDDYEITVTVTIKDGALVEFNVGGVNGSNSKYSGNAKSGILTQVQNSTAGEYSIDAVSNATCSTTAIVQAINAALAEGEALSGTYYSLSSEVTYSPAGTSFFVTVHNPEESVEYDVTLAYGVGKFSDDLEPKAEYCSIELSENTEDEQIYKITLVPGSIYKINDDGKIHNLYVNDPGTSLAVKVNDTNIGSFTIKSNAVPSITNNILSLTNGAEGEFTTYLGMIDEVAVTCTDQNGEDVTTTFTTQWQHDMEPAFLGNDLFNADGSINFDLIAEVTETGDDFEAIQDENGNNVTNKVPVFPNGANGDYRITITAGDGYEAVTAQVGASYAAKNPENSDPVNNGSENTGSENNGSGNNVQENSGSENSGSGNSDLKNADPNTSKTTANSTAKTTKASTPKTSDSANPFLWTILIGAAASGIVMTKKKIFG